MAAFRPQWYQVHSIRSAVRLPRHSGTAIEDPQTKQVQDRVHGYTDMQRRPNLLCRHTRRVDQGLLREKRQSHHRDRGRDRRDANATRRGWVRAHQLISVAHARGLLRNNHTELVAQVHGGRQTADGGRRAERWGRFARRS